MKIEAAMGSPFSCNPNGMSVEQRKAYSRLMKMLDFKSRVVTELSDGLGLSFPKTPEVILALAEWLTYETLCCPFLSFCLEILAEQPELRLGLRGPDGIKDFIRSEFELR